MPDSSYPIHFDQERKKTRLEEAFKEFYLESSRVESIFAALNDRFKTIQSDLQETNLKSQGKLAELDFVSRYLTAILQHLSQGILFIDSQGVITTYNPAVVAMLGFQESEMLFRPVWDVLPDEAFGFSLKEALKAKQCPKTTFLSWKTREGRQVELEVETTCVETHPSISPIGPQFFSPPVVQGLLILFRNITEIRRLQILANRYERLKELGEMAAMVAHEIRNPLGGIKGFATLLKQDLEGQPDLQRMATEIMDGAEGLNRFVSNVLSYTKPFKPNFESIDLVLFMQDMLRLIQADRAFNPTIKTELILSDPVIHAPADLPLLKSAILNLLVNALQAMPEGGVLTIELQKMDEIVSIKIKDTGRGISVENLEKIFSPFFTTKETGHGFGLAEVHKVVQAHEGSIDVQSQLNKGTTFTINIPLKVAE